MDRWMDGWMDGWMGNEESDGYGEWYAVAVRMMTLQTLYVVLKYTARYNSSKSRIRHLLPGQNLVQHCYIVANFLH